MLKYISGNRSIHSLTLFMFALLIGGVLFVGGTTAVAAQDSPLPRIPTAAEGAAVFQEAWGTNGSSNGQFNFPRAVDTDADGNIFVVDTNNFRIQKFDANGNYVTQWGSVAAASPNYRFQTMEDIAVGPTGLVYVTDSFYNRVTYYDNDGVYIGEWGVGNPRGIDIDYWGNVFVVDSANYQVIKTSVSGNTITQWGTMGTSNGQFMSPYGIAVDGTGRVFVSDTTNDDIQAFDNKGVFKDTWTISGTNNPVVRALDIDSGDSVYVVDSANHIVHKFNNAGAFTVSWGTLGSNNGQLDTPRGIHVLDNGDILIPDNGNHRIQRFRPGAMQRCNLTIGQTYQYSNLQAKITNSTPHAYLNQWPPNDDAFQYVVGTAVDSVTDVYVLVRTPSHTSWVEKFDVAGNFITSWSVSANSVRSAEGIDVDGAGFVYVADTENDRISRFDSDGSNRSNFGDTGVNALNDPTDVAVSLTGSLYVVDSGNDRIRWMTNSGGTLGVWGSLGSGNGQFNDPRGVAVGPDGSVYVTEFGNDRVQKFDRSGNFVTKWGSFGSGQGQFNNPRGITVDDQGSVFVADLGNHRIQQFDKDGTFIKEWGTNGSGDGEFNNPYDIASGLSGRLYIADFANNRVQWFSRSACMTVTWHDENVPSANSSTMTGNYWELNKGSSPIIVADLILPHSGYANPQVCRRYLIGGFTCGQDSFDGANVTWNGQTLFNNNYDWTVGNCAVLTPPTVTSTSYNSGTGEVTINWTGSTTNYRVYRNTTPYTTGGSYSSVNGTTSYTHNPGSITYFYNVTSYGSECGQISEPAQEVGAFQFEIVPSN